MAIAAIQQGRACKPILKRPRLGFVNSCKTALQKDAPMPAIARTTACPSNRVLLKTPAPLRPEGRTLPVPFLCNVMVIDDSRIDRALHTRTLTRSDVIGDMIDFADAGTALAYLQENATPRPDAILLDVNMPGMDAFEFLTTATGILGADFTPAVVILTSVPLPAREHERLNGFDVVRYFLEKPLLESDLHALATRLGSEIGSVSDRGYPPDD